MEIARAAESFELVGNAGKKYKPVAKVADGGSWKIYKAKDSKGKIVSFDSASSDSLSTHLDNHSFQRIIKRYDKKRLPEHLRARQPCTYKHDCICKKCNPSFPRPPRDLSIMMDPIESFFSDLPPLLETFESETHIFA